MADEPQSAAPISEVAVEAPAADFSLESALKEAQQAVEPPKADAPKATAPDSTDPSTTTDQTETETPAGEEPKSNRQAGKEAYERGLREGREAAQRELEATQARAHVEQQTTAQAREFEELLQRAQSGDLQATDRVISLMSSQRATQAALQQGRSAVLQEMGLELAQSINTLEGADADTRTALMQAPSVSDFGKLAFEHGRRLEKATWEPEIAKRDATIEQLRGQLASKSASPESANGLRSNGATTFDGSWESAFRLAQAQGAS